MTRSTAREIAVHLIFSLGFGTQSAEEVLDSELTRERFEELGGESQLYAQFPNEKQERYIRDLVRGVFAHGPELDDYIARYAVGWSFARIPRMAAAILRTAMYEVLYMPAIPNSAAINEAVEIAKNFKTLYVMGCFGAPLTGSNVSRYCNNHSYNRAADRTAMIKAAGNQNPPVYGFDCVCLIKGILWGWSGNASKTYGGANYASNGVPDIGADTMITRCLDVSATGWANMAVGEAVWMSGHIGIYIGDGLAVECSPKWENKVQITAVGNIGSKAGYNTRTWTKHGKLPYVDYSESGTTTGGGTATKPDTGGATIYKVAAGDNLSKIAAKYGTTVDALAEINAIKNKNLIRVGQVLMLQDTPQAAADKLEALGVINSPDYWAEAAEAGKVQYLDILLKKAAQTITKAGVRTDTPQEGVAALVAAGVINTPEYWLANYGTFPSLDLLLQALGGAVK